MRITENCIIPDMDEKIYHSDPCAEPSLSSTMANTLIEETEIEAKMGSQRLNPKYKEKRSDEIDLGTLAHALLLKGEEGAYEIAPYDDWRTNNAKAARIDITKRGLIALNNSTAEKFVDNVRIMRNQLFNQLEHHQDYPTILKKGKGEQSGFAYDGQIWNRARFDWIDESIPDLIVDYKTTGLSFSQWEKNELWGGKYIQNPHYRKVFDTITGRKSKFIFVVQRTVEPYLIKIFELDASYEDDINMRYLSARQRFVNCLKTGVWRGEPPYAVHSCPPPWVLTSWENQALDEKAERIKATIQPEALQA